MYLIYSALLTIAAILTSPYWLAIGLKKKKYLQNVGQRFGWRLSPPAASARPLWLHAVSVGEVLAAKVIFLALRKARPALPIVVSTVTVTGQELALREMPDAAAVFYFPFDWGWCVRRFLKRLHPRCVVLLETELWPNFLRECRRREIPVLLANGRLSIRSLRRYSVVRSLIRRMIQNVTLLAVQTGEDSERFVALGAAEEKVRITGSLKFDFPALAVDSESAVIRCAQNALRLEADSLVIVVGSTMRGEEPPILDAFVRVHNHLPQVRLILAPRHPERFTEVGEMLAQSGITFRRRSELSRSPDAAVEAVLLDTIGELRRVYSLASVAVIGGSFLTHFGGHNPLEPAALGKAIIFGPHMSNFEEIAGLFIREHAARRCTLQNLAETLLELLRDPDARRLLGDRAAATVRRNQGAIQNTVALILPHIG